MLGCLAWQCTLGWRGLCKFGQAKAAYQALYCLLWGWFGLQAMSWAANKATQWAQAHSVPIAFATALGAPKGQHPGLGVACLALAAAWLAWARAGLGVVAHVSDIPVYTPGILYTGIYLVHTKGSFAYLVYFTL